MGKSELFDKICTEEFPDQLRDDLKILLIDDSTKNLDKHKGKNNFCLLVDSRGNSSNY